MSEEYDITLVGGLSYLYGGALLVVSVIWGILGNLALSPVLWFVAGWLVFPPTRTAFDDILGMTVSPALYWFLGIALHLFGSYIWV